MTLKHCLSITKMFKVLSLLEKVQHLLVTTHYHSRELQYMYNMYNTLTCTCNAYVIFILSYFLSFLLVVTISIIMLEYTQSLREGRLSTILLITCSLTQYLNWWSTIDRLH